MSTNGGCTQSIIDKGLPVWLFCYFLAFSVPFNFQFPAVISHFSALIIDNTAVDKSQIEWIRFCVKKKEKMREFRLNFLDIEELRVDFLGSY